MSTDSQRDGRTIRLAWVLSLAGLLPMIGAAAALLMLTPDHGLFVPILEVFKTWSAIILSFLGGVRWGIAINETPVSSRALFFGIIPSAVGWSCLLLTEPLSILVLLLAYCAQGAWDSFAINSGIAPTWFGRLRIWLTMFVAAVHVAVVAAVF